MTNSCDIGFAVLVLTAVPVLDRHHPNLYRGGYWVGERHTRSVACAMWAASGLISTSKSASFGAKMESKMRIICVARRICTAMEKIEREKSRSTDDAWGDLVAREEATHQETSSCLQTRLPRAHGG